MLADIIAGVLFFLFKPLNHADLICNLVDQPFQLLAFMIVFLKSRISSWCCGSFECFGALRLSGSRGM